MNSAFRSMNVLLVEDNPTDVQMARSAFEMIEMPHCLHVVLDGEAALDYLRMEHPPASAPRPQLILLDWALPGKSGRAVLSEIKSDPQLKLIPVIVLTASQADEDILQAYDLHANCYITKPLSFEKLLHVMETIRDFWFGVVTLPPSVD
jgi:CheY-like chemotaxis protein